MLWKLFKAEINKIVAHRYATGCLLWVFPMIPVSITLLLLIAVALSSEFRESWATNGVPQWTTDATGILSAIITPVNPIGRLVLLGFAAVFLAGEYQWSTWKNIVPRSNRVVLITVKFLAISLMVLFALTLTAFLYALGSGLITMLAGYDYGPPISGDVLRSFTEDFGLQMFTTFTSILISIGYVALASMLTRSILGSVIIGSIIAIAESSSIVALALLAWLLNNEDVLQLYRFTPTYNMLNVVEWVANDQGVVFNDATGAVETLAFSMITLAVWVISLISLAIYLFQRRDITS